MAGRIPQSFIDELLARVDVIDVVDSRVKLKKTGKNYSACCPFHNENTPSFTVSPDKQFYYCFGCGATGSALKFVMEFDGLSFPDAVDKLAAQVGVEVPREQNSLEARQQQEHQPLYERLQDASQYYQQMLRQHPERQRAIDYLQQRGLSGKAAKFFGIGYAPPGWDNLLQALVSDDKERQRQLISNGMLIEKEDGRCYDRFRDRIMFPIRDQRGRTIAFGGRVLGDEKPKYLNSPETPVFQKNRELYGLFEARKIRQKLTRFVIVEGYMDVVALAEYGIHYAVATLGTATSEHHLLRLFRIVPEVIFCFDGDDAGRNAAARAMETVLPVLEGGRQARFLFLPDGDDPDTLVRREGKEAFEQRLNASDHLPEFLFKHLKQQVDFDTMDGKARFDQLAAPLIARLPQGALRDLMKQQLVKETGVASHALEKIEQQMAEQPEPVHAPEPDYVDHAAMPSEPPAMSRPNDVGARYALCSLLLQPSLADGLELPDVDAESEYERLLIEVIRKLQQAPQHNSIGVIIQWTGSPYQQELKTLAEQAAQQQHIASASSIEHALQKMDTRRLDAEWQQLQARLRAGESFSEQDKQRLRELSKQRHQRHRKRTAIYQR
ncbi:DNA primase [Bacterioplanes sanyensis]|uniref:DNA primase n=1 Tax=Bacterioplanes sanyensis TaxID=1249553 RepID=A0A222FG82_9GAMM|nr:DNA primase [Bacterioplanes sanyensis]ASP37421.1 DNA primase [Bacterioplanes sanyensis]